MSWESFEKEIERGPIAAMGAFWKVGICGLILLGLTTCGVLVVTKPFKMGAEVLSTDNIIYNYEWFKQRHEDITAIDRKIELADEDVARFKEDAGPRKDWKREDRTEASRLQSIATGLKQQRADLVADYNARSRMVNRSIFKGTDTPEEIK
jgi:hypothetical protein